MPYISSTPSGNTFYIAANIIFDLGTGESKQVLMLVNKVADASIFNAEDAQNYVNFVKVRAPKIIWSIEPLNPPQPHLPFLRPYGELEKFIIKGVQYV
jgi:hypothetical protein